MLWEHEVAGSSPVTPTMRVSYIGNTPAFQAGKVGSIPTTRSNFGECSSVGRAPDCGSGCRGFESHHSPHKFVGI